MWYAVARKSQTSRKHPALHWKTSSVKSINASKWFSEVLCYEVLTPLSGVSIVSRPPSYFPSGHSSQSHTALAPARPKATGPLKIMLAWEAGADQELVFFTPSITIKRHCQTSTDLVNSFFNHTTKAQEQIEAKFRKMQIIVKLRWFYLHYNWYWTMSPSNSHLY